MALFSLKQQTIENFVANATQQAMMVHRRVNQKKNGVIESVPLLKKMKERITEFDREMIKRLGKNYTKVRNIAVGVGKFYVAGMFGGPGIIALGSINAAQAVKPLLKHAEEQRQAGKVSGLFDYIAKNPKEASITLAAASLGAGAIAFGLAGMLNAKFTTRAAATALVVAPEMKVLKGTVLDIVNRKKTVKQAFNDFGRDILTVGISAASFIAGNYAYLAEHGGTNVGTETHAPAETGQASAEAEAGQTGNLSVGVKGADKKAVAGAPTAKTERTDSKEKSRQKTLPQINEENNRQPVTRAAGCSLALLKRQREI